MAFYRKVDFAKLCGTTTGNLSNDVKRGNAQYSGKYIDDSLEINQQYIAKRKAILEAKGEQINDTVKPIPLYDILKSDTRNPDPNGVAAQSSLKILKEKADLRKKQIDADKAQLQYEQLIGSSIPTDMVIQVISLLGQTFLASFNNGASALLDEISHRKKLKVKEKAELKGKLVGIINDAQSRAITEAQMNIDNIVKQYQDGNPRKG